MRRISVQSLNRHMQAQAELLVWRPKEPWMTYPEGTLLAGAWIGVREEVVGIASSLLLGDPLYVSTVPNQQRGGVLDSDRRFRWIHKTMGSLDHTLLLSKAAVDEALPEGVASRVLLMPDGREDRTARLFFRRFCQDHVLPEVVDWAIPVWDAAEQNGYIEELGVWADPACAWANLRAYAVRPSLNSEAARDLLSGLLQGRRIHVPTGLTDAPPVLETVRPEQGPSGQDVYRTISYLETYAPHLATAIEELAEPRHDLDRPIEPAIADMKRTPFPAQAHCAQAIVHTLRAGEKAVFISSDMGTGKSIVSLAAIRALAAGRPGYAVLMLVPGITIPKWTRDEIEATLPDARVITLDSWRDVLAYEGKVKKIGKKGLTFVLLSRDTAKLGMPKVPALVYRKRHVISDPGARWKTPRRIDDVWLCPDCGAMQVKQTKEAQKERDSLSYMDGTIATALHFDDLAKGTAADRSILWRDGTRRWHCTACGHSLMRYRVPERETVPGLKHRRIAPADLIARRLPGHFDLLLVDELHQYKNASGQGEAMAQLVGACRQVMGLTGTLSDGKASSLYHLLWRVAPRELFAQGFDHESLGRFVSQYGAVEYRTTERDEVNEEGEVTNRKTVKNPPKEIPGLSPRLFVRYLAGRCVFLELGDLGLPLVELDERPVFVPMDPEHAHAYQHFDDMAYQQAKQAMAAGNQNAFAPYMPAVVNAANQPHKEQTVVIGGEPVYFAPVMEETGRTVKERQLLVDVQAELAQDRRVVVYVRYTGQWKQDGRVADVLKEAGIRVRTLHATVSPEDRVDWLADAVRQNTQVVVCNAKLVEVGLDMLDFPTLIFYQFTDEVATMRQAARRAWRIGQHRGCRILYYVYEGSYEMKQLKRMLHKRSHALLLEGRLDRSEVSTYAQQDQHSALTRAIASSLSDVADLAAKWKRLADKDVPAGVLMLSEDHFRAEIRDAINRLSNETRRMAGIPLLTGAPVEDDQSARLPLPVHAVPQAGDDAALGGLFAVVQEDGAETSEPVVSMPEPVAVKTAAQLRGSMGMMAKAKRAKGAVGDDQLGWSF